MATPRPSDSAPSSASHWAYQPVKRVEPEGGEGIELGASTRSIGSSLASSKSWGLTHSPPASRVALIRRVTFDLAGRPPSTEEVAAFLADARPDAYVRLVDRLLASPEYGVRWGQHWLDLAHYADTNGFELDAERPDAWRYRDWIVRSLERRSPLRSVPHAPVGRRRPEAGRS